MNDAPEADGEPTIRGVSLAQYAGVEAGTAAGLPIDVVLANEKVPAEAWADAEEGWSDRILDEDDEDEPLLQAYEERLVEAQDRYGRAVKPLDDDLGAWLDFVRRWSADDDPNEMVARIGLRPADVLRLHRVWAGKIARDPAMAERAKEILSAPPGELPAITAEAVKPVPLAADRAFAHKVPPLSAVEPEKADEDDEEDEDDDEADEAEETPLFSPLPQWMEAAARAPRPAPPPPPKPARSTSQPAMPVPVAAAPQAVSHAEPAPIGPQAASHSEPAAPSPVTPRPLEVFDDRDIVTAPAQPSPFKRPALPFQPAGSAPPAIASPSPRPPPSAPSAAQPGDGQETTMISVESLMGSALPFGDTPAPAAPPSSPSALEPEGDEDQETSVISAAAFKASVLPFRDKPAPPASPSAPAREAALPSIARPPAAPSPKEQMGGTTAGVVISPFAASLPFVQKGAPAEPPKPGAAMSATGTNLPVSAPGAPSAVQGAVPPAPPISPGSAASPSNAVQLTLAQYASLCAELAASPNAKEAVFHRYGLSAARERQRVDLAWRQRFQQNPAEYREWQALYEQYHRYLSAQSAEGSGKGGGAV